ncbi:DUF7927 domain-containing protein [Leucobacter sp. HY1908]
MNDLASCGTPPTLTLKKTLDGKRAQPTDQFKLEAKWHAAQTGTKTSFGSVTTTGSDIGLQKDQLGPVPVLSGNWYTISETGVNNADLQNNYETSWACFVNGNPEPAYKGIGTTGTFHFQASNSYRGGEIECEFTNRSMLPNLVVSKQSDPASGVAVDPGNTVKFSLAFDNTEGSAAATELSYTDHLADVLDDANFVGNSLKVRDVTATDPADHTDITTGFFAFYDQAAKKIKIAGAADGTGTATVPAGKKYAVVYEVTVKQNVDAEGNTRESGTGTTAYRLTNYLVKGNETPPTTCTPPAQEDEQPLCSDHHVRSWTASKKESRPASGATLHAGGNIYYSLEVEKADASYPIDGIVVTDDLTDVYDYATWDASAPDLSAQGALTRGIYFFNAAGNVVRTINQGDLPTGTTLDEWVPAPTEAGGKWTLATKPFELEAGEVKAQVWFAVKINNPLTGEVGAPFINTYSALAGSSEPKPNQCETGEPSTHKAACKTSHQVAEDFFAIRKDGTGTLADGTRGPLTNLIGHQFEIRVDDNGTMGTNEPANKCDVTGSNAQTCWSFAPIASGEQAGRWRADRLPAGTYWLLETQAPKEQRVDANTKRSVTGVQLLAEPIKFRVASSAESGTDHPAPGVPDKNVILGQVDVFKPGATTLLDRCDADGTDARPTACSNPTGYLMVVSDPGALPLPFTGAAAPWLLGVGGLAGLGLLIAGFYYWSSRRQTREL